MDPGPCPQEVSRVAGRKTINWSTKCDNASEGENAAYCTGEWRGGGAVVVVTEDFSEL